MRNIRATDMLDAGEDLIRRVGFDGFSIRQIAEATGVRTASVRYHFPTKADLGAATRQHGRLDDVVAALVAVG